MRSCKEMKNGQVCTLAASFKSGEIHRHNVQSSQLSGTLFSCSSLPSRVNRIFMLAFSPRLRSHRTSPLLLLLVLRKSGVKTVLMRSAAHLKSGGLWKIQAEALSNLAARITKQKSRALFHAHTYSLSSPPPPQIFSDRCTCVERSEEYLTSLDYYIRRVF